MVEFNSLENSFKRPFLDRMFKQTNKKKFNKIKSNLHKSRKIKRNFVEWKNSSQKLFIWSFESIYIPYNLFFLCRHNELNLSKKIQ